MSSVIRGLRVGEAVITSILLLGGTGIAAGQSRFRPLVGWLLLALGAVVLIIEIKHWVKVVPAVFAYGILMALLQLQTGQIPGHIGLHVSRLQGLWVLLLYVGIAVVSATIALRKLTVLDEVALLAFVGLFLWGYVAPSSINGLIKMTSGLGCLFVAWVFDRVKRRGSRHQRGAEHAH